MVNTRNIFALGILLALSGCSDAPTTGGGSDGTDGGGGRASQPTCTFGGQMYPPGGRVCWSGTTMECNQRGEWTNIGTKC
jgi:hypothetical protein